MSSDASLDKAGNEKKSNLSRDCSYFVALVMAGSTALLLVLGPVVNIVSMMIAVAMGISPDADGAKMTGYAVVAIAWTAFLTRYWIRNKALSPRTIKASRETKFAWGHRCLITGHVLVLCVVFVEAFAFLMILPVLGVLFCYGGGIVLIETARDRSRG